jgi:hypothetical protein
MAQTISSAAPRASLVRLTSPVLVGALAAAIYSINLDYIPLFDELYHVLGAQGFLEHGEPRIADGVYQRATLFTALVALWFDWFGQEVVVARSLSVFAGAVMMACVFSWTRAVAGTGTAWVATIAFLLSPFSVRIFQYARFYSIHALLFWLGAVATYAATANQASLRRAAVLTPAALVCFAAAFYFQITTAIGLVGVALWLMISVALPMVRAVAPAKRRALIAGGAIIGAALAVFVLGIPYEELLQRYRSTPLWNASSRNDVWFYHFWLILYYPTLWSIFPVAALIALVHKPKPALFSLCIFVPALVLHSFAGPKDLDYLFYAVPFLFITWAIAFVAVLAALRRFLVATAERALHAIGFAPSRYLVTGVLAASIGFIVLANTATVRTAAMLAGVTVPPEVTPPDWAAAAQPLRPWLEQASVVLTTSELETLYFLGDYDVLISKSRLSEVPERHEFGSDPRTGRPIVSTPGSVGLIIDCFPDGLIVTSKHRWRIPHQLDDAIADYIIRHTVPIDLPKSSQIMAFHWERPPGAVAPATCADLSIGSIADGVTSDQ